MCKEGQWHIVTSLVLASACVCCDCAMYLLLREMQWSTQLETSCLLCCWEGGSPDRICSSRGTEISLDMTTAETCRWVAYTWNTSLNLRALQRDKADRIKSTWPESELKHFGGNRWIQGWWCNSQPGGDLLCWGTGGLQPLTSYLSGPWLCWALL